MFERLDRVPDDPILGLMAAFRADSDPKKVDLGVGVFRDAAGIPRCSTAFARLKKPCSSRS